MTRCHSSLSCWARSLQDALLDALGQPQLLVDLGGCDVGDVFPGLIRHPRDHLEDLELRQATFPSVDQIQEDEQHSRRNAVAAPRRRQRLSLGRGELLMGQARRDTGTGSGRRLSHSDRLETERAEMTCLHPRDRPPRKPIRPRRRR